VSLALARLTCPANLSFVVTGQGNPTRLARALLTALDCGSLVILLHNLSVRLDAAALIGAILLIMGGLVEFLATFCASAVYN
jgi:hypothetical protein